MAELYRAEASRQHSGKWTPRKWRGKWRPDPQRAIAQAKRWRESEPLAHIVIVCSNGMSATLEELERAQVSGYAR